MNRAAKLLTTALPLIALATAAHAMDGVVASIKPIHSLVAAVMGDTGTPALIVKGASSPHGFTMRPSDAAAVQDAKLIFWVGPQLEPFLEKPIETLAGDAAVVTLGEVPGIVTLPPRAGGAFEKHVHHHDDGDEHEEGDHDHDHDADADHDHEEDHDHDHAHDEDHGHDAAHDEDHDHEEDHDHDHGGIDPHIWLDPENARAMTEAIAAALEKADPENADTYKANAAALEARLDALESGISAELAPVKDKHYIVFHDAYQYFEKRFGIEAAGSITVSPEVLPGAARLTEIRDKVRSLGVACVFSEPQFDPALVTVVTEGTNARTGVLDPLGAALEPGADLYPTVLQGLADSFSACLTQG